MSQTQTVIAWAHRLEVPLLSSLAEIYPDRGWRLCGATSIALARLISARTGIPIGYNNPGERLELGYSLFEPGDLPYDPDDHAHLRYYTGTGHVLYVDPLYRLLWSGFKDLP